MRFLFISLFFITTSIHAQNIIGKWQTIDDNTGKARSIVEITEKDGKAYGRILKLYREHDEDQDPI